MQILKRLLDGGFMAWAAGDEVIINHDDRTVPMALATEVQAHKSEILETLKRGEKLLKALWAAGYWIYIERRSDGEGFFLLPRGQSRLPPSEMEKLFDLYEECHDDALLVLLLGLSVTPAGTRDVDWWNRAADAMRSGRIGLALLKDNPWTQG